MPTKRSPHQRDDDQPIDFTNAASNAPQAPDARARGKRGPARKPDSLRAQVAAGEASHLHTLVPADLHRRLKVRSAMTGKSVSELVAEACARYLDATSEA